MLPNVIGAVPLNIDAPESADCLYQEATDHLGSLLPVGTEVTLEYDVERTDRYARTLAGVVKTDGTLVNAEMARTGLVGVISIGENVRFYAQVSSAMWEASTQKRGLHSVDIACTVPTQVQAFAKAAETSAQPLTGTPTELTAAADVVTTTVARADALLVPRGLIWTALSAGDQSAFRSLVMAAHATLGQREKDLRAAATAATIRAAEEKRKAEEAAEEERRRDQEEQSYQPPANPYPGGHGRRALVVQHPAGCPHVPLVQRTLRGRGERAAAAETDRRAERVRHLHADVAVLAATALELRDGGEDRGAALHVAGRADLHRARAGRRGRFCCLCGSPEEQGNAGRDDSQFDQHSSSLRDHG